MNSPFTIEQDAAIDKVQAMRLDYDHRYHPSKLPGMDAHAEPKSTGITLRHRAALSSARSDSRRTVDDWRRSPRADSVAYNATKASRLERLTSWLWHQHDHSTALWTVLSLAFLAGTVALITGIWKP
jgi:hypothetical protein